MQVTCDTMYKDSNVTAVPLFSDVSQRTPCYTFRPRTMCSTPRNFLKSLSSPRRRPSRTYSQMRLRWSFSSTVSARSYPLLRGMMVMQVVITPGGLPPAGLSDLRLDLQVPYSYPCRRPGFWWFRSCLIMSRWKGVRVIRYSCNRLFAASRQHFGPWQSCQGVELHRPGRPASKR
jgi:hypothetical protein